MSEILSPSSWLSREAHGADGLVPDHLPNVVRQWHARLAWVKEAPAIAGGVNR